MKFSKDYSKLKKMTFTTIRKNTKFYKEGTTCIVVTPKEQFMAKVSSVKPIKKDDITEELAQKDADCSREELIKMLERWYGKEHNDFALINLERI